MPDFNVRSDSVNVEQIMEQIRVRIREKRGVDYSEQQVRELAAAKLEKLLEQFRRAKPPERPPNFTFEGETLFESPSGLVRAIRRLLRPLLRLFFNPGVLADALHVQSQLNTRQAQLEASRHMLYDELIHNLVIEAARLGLEVKSLKMRVESLATRLEFSERRARSLESTITYGPAAQEREVPAPFVPSSPPPPLPQMPPPAPSMPSPPVAASSAPSVSSGTRPMGPAPPGAPDGQRRRRRRRRRGRRGGSGAANAGAQVAGGGPPTPGSGASGAPQHNDVQPADSNAGESDLDMDEPDADESPMESGGADSHTASEPSGGSGNPGGPGEPGNGDR